MKGDRYEVGKIVGSGAFATVHEAKDLRLDSTVAIKMLAQNWAADPSVCERFGREATLLRRVRSSHRNAPLAEVFDIDQADDGRPYFVMSFADRGTLSARWTPGQPWPLVDVLPVIDTLTDGLHALHSEGVVHRDIKPSNMLYVSQPSAPAGEELLIGDLGLAKDTLVSTSELTVAGGTPGYMAPEQAHPDATITPGADIYAATVLVAELLTGVRGPQALTSLPAHAQLEFHKGMSQHAHDRHSSIREWRTAILAALNSTEPITAIDSHAPNLGGATNIVTPPPPPMNQPAAASAGQFPGVSPSSSPPPVSAEAGSTTKSKSLLMAAVAGVLALVVAGVLAAFVLNGGSSISVDGPVDASVGETLFLRPEIPADAQNHFWTVAGQRVSDADLRLTPSSTGPIIVELTAVLADGSTETVTHRIDVS